MRIQVVCTSEVIIMYSRINISTTIRLFINRAIQILFPAFKIQISEIIIAAAVVAATTSTTAVTLIMTAISTLTSMSITVKTAWTVFTGRDTAAAVAAAAVTPAVAVTVTAAVAVTVTAAAATEAIRTIHHDQIYKTATEQKTEI